MRLRWKLDELMLHSMPTSQVKVLENAEKERKYLKPCKVRLARLDPLDEHLQAVSKTIKEFQTLTRVIAERLPKKQHFFTTLYVGMKPNNALAVPGAL